jgi:hypothetical protein
MMEKEFCRSLEEIYISFHWRNFMAKLLLSIFLFVSPLLGQWEVGPILYVNSSSFGGLSPSEGSYENRTGLGFGVHFAYNLNDAVAFYFEPGYQQHGALLVIEDNLKLDSTRTYDMNVNYLALPLGARIFAMDSKFFAAAGLQIGIPLNSHIIYPDGERENVAGLDYVDVGALFGLGYQLSIYDNPLDLEIRYLQGFVNVNARTIALKDGIEIPPFKSTGFIIRLNYNWRFGS